MRYIKLLLTLFCLTAWTFAAPKTITSSVAFQDPQGNVLANGQIIFTLSSPCNLIGGGQVVPTVVTVTLTAGGLIPGATTITANDQCQPTGTTYGVKIYNSNGLLVSAPCAPGGWIISGASPIDLSQETCVNIPDPGLGSPVLQNPSAAQTITGQAFNLSSSAPFTANGTVNFVQGLQQNGTALGQNCGTTTICGNTATALMRVVFGSVALSSGTPSTATVTGFSPAFTSTSTFFCMATNATTAADSVKIVNASSSSITITGPNTVTDTINYVCVGT